MIFSVNILIWIPVPHRACSDGWEGGGEWRGGRGYGEGVTEGEGGGHGGGVG